LALIQLWVQLTFFLHLNLEANNRWNLSIFISTVGVVLILILGSLWIMQNLDYRHMSPQQLDSYILQTEGFQK
jgi:cytochrome o ubiquinol oxidase operon protein cyoD